VAVAAVVDMAVAVMEVVAGKWHDPSF